MVMYRHGVGPHRPLKRDVKLARWTGPKLLTGAPTLGLALGSALTALTSDRKHVRD